MTSPKTLSRFAALLMAGLLMTFLFAIPATAQDPVPASADAGAAREAREARDRANPLGAFSRGLGAGPQTAEVGDPVAPLGDVSQSSRGVSTTARSGLRCFGRHVTIVGTPHRDRIYGTTGQDVVWGGGGNDIISTGDANDFICAGNGWDQVYSLAGNDKVKGQKGRDIIFGGLGGDFLFGELVTTTRSPAKRGPTSSGVAQATTRPMAASRLLTRVRARAPALATADWVKTATTRSPVDLGTDTLSAVTCTTRCRVRVATTPSTVTQRYSSTPPFVMATTT